LKKPAKLYFIAALLKSNYCYIYNLTLINYLKKSLILSTTCYITMLKLLG